MLPLILIPMVALFYMRTSFFYLSHGFGIFSKIFSLFFFLTFLFQFPAWEFYKSHLWALLCYPCSHILIAIHPVRGGGAVYLGSPSWCSSSLPPLPGELGTPPLALSQTLGTVMRTLQPCRWHGRGVGALEASPYLGASSTQGIWHIADLEDAH